MKEIMNTLIIVGVITILTLIAVYHYSFRKLDVKTVRMIPIQEGKIMSLNQYKMTKKQGKKKKVILTDENKSE